MGTLGGFLYIIGAAMFLWGGTVVGGWGIIVFLFGMLCHFRFWSIFFLGLALGSWLDS